MPGGGLQLGRQAAEVCLGVFFFFNCQTDGGLSDIRHLSPLWVCVYTCTPGEVLYLCPPSGYTYIHVRLVKCCASLSAVHHCLTLPPSSTFPSAAEVDTPRGGVHRRVYAVALSLNLRSRAVDCSV